MTPVLVDRADLANVALGLTLQRLRDGQPVAPLTDGQANAQALRLRERGLSYNTIAAVMSLYHGIDVTEHGWRHRCRRGGAPPKFHGAGIVRRDELTGRAV